MNKNRILEEIEKIEKRLDDVPTRNANARYEVQSIQSQVAELYGQIEEGDFNG